MSLTDLVGVALLGQKQLPLGGSHWSFEPSVTTE